ncbi:serine/threonine-protein kinase PknH/PknJ [Mycobacterium numidiamassiliense]|uniref:serine/threonine-protein kinase PknH/PknJ n=1 Tax=Mycobacterium numidiamassiliense TaxID=1841861 RepID=UPI00097E1480|nr:serine/threonine-protein kinase PknH/PknJ [Mycobacterium numidiamassiliense]
MDGTPFGRYRLIELLGRGGMGEVWRAHDTATNRTVAIKLLPPQLAQDHTFVQRFRREAEAAAQLNSPHIIPIHDYGEIDGRLFVNMRLIEGRDLHEILADGPLEPARAVRIIEQIAKALNAAHKIGLVHRDVKPSNILLDEDDFAYLIDFGIARGADETRLTGTGSIIGSWHYMSPERMRAGEVDARSDVYALACVLYECLTAATPFPGDSAEQQITAHLMAPPPRPSISHPTVPATLDTVIAIGMAKDPDQRYPTTAELATAAQRAMSTRQPDQNHYFPPSFASPPAPAMPVTQAAAPRLPVDPNFVATQQAPAGQQRVDPRTRRNVRRRQMQLGLIAALVVILVAGAGVTGYVLLQPRTTSQSAGAPQPSAASRPSAPVAEAALDGLLLTPDQVDTTLGITGATVAETTTDMEDNSSHVADAACRPLAGNAIAPVYAGSGWKAFRENVIREPGGKWTRGVDQSVVLFPSAQDAGAFFTTSAQQWPACANRQFTMTRVNAPDQLWTVGPVANTGGTLSATYTRNASPGWSWESCQRALTVANNVVVDVDECNLNQSDAPRDAGVNVARQIAAKVAS